MLQIQHNLKSLMPAIVKSVSAEGLTDPGSAESCSAIDQPTKANG